jgi:hypothetical protein
MYVQLDRALYFFKHILGLSHVASSAGRETERQGGDRETG